MNDCNNKQISSKDRPVVELRYRSEDWGGHQSEIQTLSIERIIQNERLRNFMEAYLNDVELIGWENLSDDELNDILLESILNHNSYHDCDWYDRYKYKSSYHEWVKYKRRLTNYASGKTKDDGIIGKNICGYIPICIKTSRINYSETQYFCRNAITKELVRVKQSELTRLEKGEEVPGLRPDKVDSSRKVG